MLAKLFTSALTAGLSAGLLTASLWTLAPTSTMRVQHRAETMLDQATWVSPDVTPEPGWGLIVTPGPTS
jgi:hypothetical protein